MARFSTSSRIEPACCRIVVDSPFGLLLFGKLIGDAAASKDITGIAIGYFIGAALMVLGGIVAAVLGVRAEGKSLEAIAQPLTAEDAQGSLAANDKAVPDTAESPTVGAGDREDSYRS